MIENEPMKYDLSKVKIGSGSRLLNAGFVQHRRIIQFNEISITDPDFMYSSIFVIYTNFSMKN